MGFSAKCRLCDVVQDHAENSKLNATNLRLILLDHHMIFYHNSTQCTVPQVTVPQCSSWCSDGNLGTASRYNTDAVEYGVDKACIINESQ